MKYIYVWIYENEAKGVKLLTKRASKGDDIKIKRIVSPFFLPLPLYLAFTALLSLFLARLHGMAVNSTLFLISSKPWLSLGFVQFIFSVTFLSDFLPTPPITFPTVRPSVLRVKSRLLSSLPVIARGVKSSSHGSCLPTFC